MRKIGGRDFVNFPSLNYQRYFGEEWLPTVSKGIHDRMRSWGLNTLGCWSDEKLQREKKTPYVLISSIWWQASGHRKFPSPFRDNFQSDLEKNLKKLSWAKNDPFCLGVFIGNELEWPDRIGSTIQSLPPEHPTKKWAMKELTKLGKPTSPPKISDFDSLYYPFAKTFFSKCKKALENQLPETLFLGCRTHRGPNILGRAAMGSVDVFRLMFTTREYARGKYRQISIFPFSPVNFILGRWIVVSQARDFRVHGIKGKEPFPLLTTFLLL